MIINDNSQFIYKNRNNFCGTKLFKIPVKKQNNQSRNINKNNFLLKQSNLRKSSLYSTEEATPRKECKNVLEQSAIKNNFYSPKETKSNELDDSLSQISQVLNKKNLNFSWIADNILGINEEPNFVYNQILQQY